MFINKKRIEEDLEIFRRFVSNQKQGQKPPKEATDKKADEELKSQEKLGFSEFIGLCGAAFVTILPWVLAFAALVGLLGRLLVLWVA